MAGAARRWVCRRCRRVLGRVWRRRRRCLSFVWRRRRRQAGERGFLKEAELRGLLARGKIAALGWSVLKVMLEMLVVGVLRIRGSAGFGVA